MEDTSIIIIDGGQTLHATAQPRRKGLSPQFPLSFRNPKGLTLTLPLSALLAFHEHGADVEGLRVEDSEVGQVTLLHLA